MAIVVAGGSVFAARHAAVQQTTGGWRRWRVAGGLLRGYDVVKILVDGSHPQAAGGAQATIHG